MAKLWHLMASHQQRISLTTVFLKKAGNKYIFKGFLLKGGGKKHCYFWKAAQLIEIKPDKEAWLHRHCFWRESSSVRLPVRRTTPIPSLLVEPAKGSSPGQPSGIIAAPPVAGGSGKPRLRSLPGLRAVAQIKVMGFHAIWREEAKKLTPTFSTAVNT